MSSSILRAEPTAGLPLDDPSDFFRGWRGTIMETVGNVRSEGPRYYERDKLKL
jgi:hypothetical protein